MASNNLTPEQDLITREFYSQVASNDTLFPSNPAMQRQMLAVILTHLLNYDVVDGKFVTKGTHKTRTLYDDTTNVICEWDKDVERAVDALGEQYATDSNTGTDKTNSSVEATRAAIRKTLLRKDV